MFLSIATLAWGLSSPPAPVPISAQQTDHVMVGVMRRDGVAVPFAAYDGEWSTPWPVLLHNIEVPINLDAVPKKWWGGDMPQKWTLWQPAGESSPLSVFSPALVFVGREKRLGIRTNYRSNEALPGPFELPYPKDGLAVSGDVKVESIPAVSKQAAAFRNLTTSLLEEIDAAEQKAIDRLGNSVKWRHPFSRAFRRGTPTTLEAWYTSTLEQPGFGLSYIEGVKKYPPGEDDQACGLETFVSGWIHTNNRVPKPRADLTARITYCDRNGISYMLPLGRFQLKNRTHWAFQMSSWEQEWYAIVEATPGRVRFVAEYYGGGRPRIF